MAIKCPKCHSNNPDDSVYCSKCATPLKAAEEMSVPTKTLEAAKEELTTGSTFAGRYQIIEELGKGGMGKVYKAQDTEIKEKIALKLIKPEIAADKKTIERFRNELKYARKIRHQNVCQMYDLNKEEGSYYITMEYVTGEDLKGLIRRVKQIPIGTAIAIAKQVCEGLTEAHRLGVVHRDLKSSNIMIDKEGDARIMDFGIARSITGKGLTGAGVMIGTPEYMSPEQAEVKEVDQRSDIYSLGVILYEMVTGRVPFEGETPLSIAMKHKSEMPKDPRELNNQIPEDLSRVILRCMEKDKEERYQSAGEVSSELKGIEKGIPTTEREIPKRKPITSREITVTFGLKKLFIPALVVISIAVIGIIIWKLLLQKEVVSIPSGKPSIAVLPFEDLSPQKDQEYFCDGLAEELINRLTNIENLRVPARTSAFSFKRKDVDIREIGEKLSAEMVLDGSVRKAGNKLRITAQLVKTADGYPVWSKIYERNLDDTFALQDEISLAIVDTLKIKLLGGEKAKITKRYTENLQAYNLYLQGRFFMNRRSLEKAADLFEQAIEKDPAYALAYADLGYAYATIGDWGNLPPKEAFPKAKECATKALELDDSLGEAYSSLAQVKYIFEWDWQSAEQDFKRAIELNPNYAPAHQEYAEYLTKRGRFEEAVQEIKRAQELEPFSVIFHTMEGWILIRARQYDKAIEKLKRVLDMDPGFLFAKRNLGSAYLGKKMYEEALALFQGLNERNRSALTYAKMGKLPEAQVILKNIIKESMEIYIPPSLIAHIYFAIGDSDKGFKWLEQGYAEHCALLCRLKISPEVDSVRSDPRLKALLKKVNLE